LLELYPNHYKPTILQELTAPAPCHAPIIAKVEPVTPEYRIIRRSKEK
jgi:hypothetical protein